MKNVSICLLLMTGLGLSFPTAQAETPAGPAVSKIDPSLDGIIASDAKLEILKGSISPSG